MKEDRFSQFVISLEERDTYPNNFKCWVTFTDYRDKTFHKRRGYGKFIGNFSPIWITYQGKRSQLTEMERETL